MHFHFKPNLQLLFLLSQQDKLYFSQQAAIINLSIVAHTRGVIEMNKGKYEGVKSSNPCKGNKMK